MILYIYFCIHYDIHIYFLISKKNGVCLFLMIGLVKFICELENIFDLNIKIELVLFRKTAIYFFLSSDSYYDTGNCCCWPKLLYHLDKDLSAFKKKRKENQLMIGKSRVNDILDYVLEKKLIWLKMNEIYFLLKILLKFWRFLI